MGRKPRVDRSPEEKWQIVQEGIKSGNVSETCRRYGGAINYYHQDHLGVRLITDAGGNDVGEQGTFPFGEAWYQNNTTTQWTFTTYQRDSESGLDYALARYYDSRMGSFCSADPVEGDLADPESWNRYAYARDNPVSISDPRGQFIQFLVGLFEWLGYVLVQGAADTADFAAYLSFDFEANQQSFNGAAQFTDFSGPPGGTGLEFWSGGGGGPLRGVVPSINQNIEKFLCDQGLKMANKDMAAVDRANRDWGLIEDAAQAYSIDPAMLAAVGVRESGFQNVNEGDGAGVGVGIYQLTVSSGDTLMESVATDPSRAALYAAGMLRGDMDYLGSRYPSYTGIYLLQATAADYNMGPVNRRTGRSNFSGNPDTIDLGTAPGGAKGNYGTNILLLMNCF